MTDPIPVKQGVGDQDQPRQDPSNDHDHERPENDATSPSQASFLDAAEPRIKRGEARPRKRGTIGPLIPRSHSTTARPADTGKVPRHHTPPRRLIPPDLSREEAVRRLGTYYRLARIVMDSDYDVDQIVQGTARLAADALGDMAVISLLNTHGETYHIAAYYDPDPEIMQLFAAVQASFPNDRISLDHGWAARVINSGKPILMPEVQAEQVLPAAVPAYRAFVQRAGLTSMLVVPICGQSGTFGALAVNRHAGGRAYNETDQYFLGELAFQVGLAIETATLVGSLRGEIGARLFAREALIASEERFLSIFRSSAQGIKVMDLVGTVLETNNAFQQLSGYEEAQLIAMHFYDLVHPDDVGKVMDVFTRLKTRRSPSASVEHRLIRRDGSSIWVKTTFAGVRKSPGDDTLSLIFGIAEDITARKQMDAEVLELKRHLQRSIELERLRLAQNLHDVPLQELYAAIYKLEELRPMTRPVTSDVLGQVITDIKKTLDGLRATASELRPPALSRFGLEKAIRSYAEDFKLKYPKIELQLSLAQDHQLLAEEVRLGLFRVFQQAIANVARHSEATQVSVLFTFDAEEARLEVTDNGKGFVVPDNWMINVREGHYGLAGMAERVTAAGGTLSLESQPGGPTSVRAVMPC